MEWVCAQQRYTRRKQTLSAQPKACFATTASGSCLCVLEGSSVTMHLANGDTHVVALPCKAVGLWALPAGVLVEPPRADGGPVAHLLNEPLEELRSVVMTRASASPEPPGDILLSSARAPLVLTHQPRARAHALWRVAGGGTPGGAAELAAWWEQPAGSAASAAESSFFAPEDGGAGVGELPLLLCVAQPERAAPPAPTVWQGPEVLSALQGRRAKRAAQAPRAQRVPQERGACLVLWLPSATAVAWASGVRQGSLSSAHAVRETLHSIFLLSLIFCFFCLS